MNVLSETLMNSLVAIQNGIAVAENDSFVFSDNDCRGFCSGECSGCGDTCSTNTVDI